MFNTEKLDWFNHQHLLRLTDEEILARLEVLGLGVGGLGSDHKTRAVLQLLRPRCKKLTDFPDQMRPFFEDPSQYDADAVKKQLSAPGTKDHLNAQETRWLTQNGQKPL